MKHALIRFLAVLLPFACLLTGCGLGTYTDTPGISAGGASATVSEESTSEISSGSASESSSDVTDTTPYTVTVYNGTSPFSYDPENEPTISVIFRGDSETVSVPLNADGSANAGVLDGEFHVYLSGLPEEYSYDPNLYLLGGEKRHADILLSGITVPAKGNGGINAKPASTGIYQSGGCFQTGLTGTYRITCEKGQFYYYEFTPQTSGRYSVQSLCNVYEDEVNPVLQIYNGTVGFKWLAETRDEGGPVGPGGFTKNFKYELHLTDSEVRNTYTFGVSAVSKDGEYPVTVDFQIKYEGPYTGPDDIVETVVAQETARLPKPAMPKEDEYMVYADLGTKHFSPLDCRYDPTKGYYRVYDAELYADTDGWGPALLCNLKKAIPCFTTTTLYNANAVGETQQNLLRLGGWSDTYEAVVILDYTTFIRTSYAAKCNDDGVCYVTKELQEFLQNFANAHRLWTDGVSPTLGSPEALGYTATQDDLWLFACGYYAKRQS